MTKYKVEYRIRKGSNGYIEKGALVLDSHISIPKLAATLTKNRINEYFPDYKATELTIQLKIIRENVKQGG